jgi:hypothetical protein
VRLRKLLSVPSLQPQAIGQFIQQHTEVHLIDMSISGNLSIEDEVVIDMNGLQMRELPEGMDHSIAWILWHLARIKDVTMNILVAGKDQIFYHDDWHLR